MKSRIGTVSPIVLLAGCSIQQVEPVPFIGMAPQQLLVAPVENLSGQPGLEEAFVKGAADQLRDRGYYVFPTDTGLSMLRGQDPTVENLVRTGAGLSVDGVLVITVTGWYAVFDQVLETLTYDVSYRILSTMDGQVIWQKEAGGDYHRERQPVQLEARRDPGPAFPGIEGSVGGASFRDNASVASALSREVFQYLPFAPGSR